MKKTKLGTYENTKSYQILSYIVYNTVFIKAKLEKIILNGKES